jgi:hypothetical protein
MVHLVGRIGVLLVVGHGDKQIKLANLLHNRFGRKKAVVLALMESMHMAAVELVVDLLS